MSKIDHEIKLLLEMAASGKLPAYPQTGDNDTYYEKSPCTAGLSEYSSGENDVMECQLKALWKNNEELQKCIPIILAAVEKCRIQKSNAAPHTELYNYTM